MSVFYNIFSPPAISSITGDLAINGDLNVTGDINQAGELNTTDALLCLNDGETGAGVTPAIQTGIKIDRGTETDYIFGFDEVSDQFLAGLEGALAPVAFGPANPADGLIAFGASTGDRYAEDANFVWIDATNRLGVNQSSPLATLHASGGASGVTPVAAVDFFLEDSASTTLELGVPENGESQILFSDVASAGAGRVYYDHSANRMILYTATAGQVYIDSNGDVGIGVTTPTEKLEVNGAIVIGGAAGTANGTVRYSGTDFEGRVGGAWVSLTSAASGADGSIQFASGGDLASDNANLFWDDASNELGVGTATPRDSLHVVGGVFADGNDAATIGAPDLWIEGGSNTGRVSQIGLGYGPTATNSPVIIAAETQQASGSTDADLIFATRSVTTDTAATERMRLTTEGRFGIGVTPAAESLELSGAIVIGDAAGTANGTIRYTGSDIEGRVGGAWVPLTTQGASSSGVAGAVQLSDGAGGFNDDGGVLFFDTTNNSLGVGMNTPGNYALYVRSSNDFADAFIDNTSGTGRGATFVCAKSGVQKQVYGSSGKVAGDTSEHALIFCDSNAATGGEIRLATGGVGTIKFRLDKSGYMNIGTDTGTLTEMLKVQGGIVLGSAVAGTPANGTMQWTGSDFQGRVGGAWVSLTQQGTVDTTGTPANNQVAIFTDADTIEGDSGFTFDGNTLLIENSDTGATASADADELVVETSGNTGITILAGGTSVSNLYFGTGSDADIGRITYNHSTEAMTFYTNNAQSVQIDSAGKTGFGVSPIANQQVTVQSDTAADNALYVKHSTSSGFVNNVLVVESGMSGSSAFDLAQFGTLGDADTQFRLQGDGNAYADVAWNDSEADYAEMFESTTGEAIADGTSVVILEDRKIRPAEDGEDPDGVISAAPGVVGNNPLNWQKKWQRDDYGRKLLDSDGNKILNPDWDPASEFVTRDQRPEWCAVGMLGMVPVTVGQPVSSRWKRIETISDTVDLYLVR